MKHVYEIRPRKRQTCVDLLSDARRSVGSGMASRTQSNNAIDYASIAAVHIAL